MSLCLVQLIEPIFRSIEHRISGFFKTVLWLFQNIIFKKFFNFFSLSPTWQGCTQIFCRFLHQFLLGFPLSRLVRPFYPSFWFYFHVFMHFFHAFKGYFRTSLDLGFLLIQCYFSKIDHWVLLGYWYIHDCCWLICSI